MEIEDLTTGTKLELDFLDMEQDGKLGKVPSKLQGNDGKYLLIDAPVHGTVVYPVHIGTLLYVYFNRKTDRQIDVFRFKAVVVGREFSGNLALIKIEPEGRAQMIQRRQYFRLDCSLPVRYRPVTVMNPAYYQEKDFRNALTRNLSGGGVCIASEQRVNIGETLECEIGMEEISPFRFYGTVVRLAENEVSTKYKYLVGIVFKKIDNKHREAVVKYIFEQQRKLRKKGLI